MKSSDAGLLYGLTPEELGALTLYGESRGELLSGQVAVANVIHKRADYNKSNWKQVTLKANQFSCWNSDDPNYPVLIELATEINKYGTYAIRGNLSLMQCYTVASLAMQGLLIDNVNGATNYMTTALFNSDDRPSWANVPKHDPTIIGRHTFFDV